VDQEGKRSEACITNTKERVMNRRRLLTVTVGVLVLSVGLARLAFMADNAVAGTDDKGDKGRGSSLDLSNIMQNWDKALPSDSRFTVLSSFNNEAVRDNNTGLVWEKSPQTAAVTWNGARFTCINKNIGGQKGWRLPSIPDLASLIDPSVASPGPTLPSGHPFNNVQSAGYWSATTSAEDSSNAWFAYYGLGFVDNDGKTLSGHVWCVRGGMNADAY
jgi:hypothetical protein